MRAGLIQLAAGLTLTQSTLLCPEREAKGPDDTSPSEQNWAISHTHKAVTLNHVIIDSLARGVGSILINHQNILF